MPRGTPFERRLGVVERLFPAPEPPIDSAAAAAAYAASLLESFEMPREDISVHEAMRRYQALLERERRRG
jgi:hypothetical protein